MEHMGVKREGTNLWKTHFEAVHYKNEKRDEVKIVYLLGIESSKNSTLH